MEPKYGSPAYTARLLVAAVVPPEGKTAPSLKPFAHFTLGCTSRDESAYAAAQLNSLAKLWDWTPLRLKVRRAVQLGIPHCPVWTAELELATGDRQAISDAFDPVMCPEKNGLFLWQADAKREGAILNESPHVTIGPTDQDKETAEALVGCTMVFGQMDYKRVGRFDPIMTVRLERPRDASET
jgi:hypothetical protein